MQRFQTRRGLVDAVSHTRVRHVQHEHLLFLTRFRGSCEVHNVDDRDIVRFDKNVLCYMEIQQTMGVYTFYVYTFLVVQWPPEEHFDQRSRGVHKDVEDHYIGLDHHHYRVDIFTDFDAGKLHERQVQRRHVVPTISLQHAKFNISSFR